MMTMPKDCFVVFLATMLRSIKKENIVMNDVVYACMMPHGKYYLSKYGTQGNMGNQSEVFETDAVEGIDFDRV